MNKIHVEIQYRTFNVVFDDEDISYALKWGALADRLHNEDWIRSTDGPYPACPGLVVEVETDMTNGEVIERIQKIAQPFLTAAKRAHSRGLTTGLRYG